MVSLSSLSDVPLADAISRLAIPAGTIADVGGGRGGQLLAILRANPGLKGVLYDFPPVLEAARVRIQGDGQLTDRVTFSPGDFSGELPEGRDLYLMKSIIHNLGDEEAVALLSRCQRAMGLHSKLLLAEMVMGHDSPPFTKFMDVVMLALSGGKERTGQEYKELLAKASLRMEKIVETGTPISLLVAAQER